MCIHYYKTVLPTNIIIIMSRIIFDKDILANLEEI